VPVSHNLPVGPQIHLRLSANHESYKVPSTYRGTGTSARRTFNALSYVTDNGWIAAAA
jgi:hypothetical protein